MRLKNASRIRAAILIPVLSLSFLLFPSSPPAERALAGDYHAQYYSQGGVRVAWAGETRDVWARYTNSGASTWTAGGPPPVRLGIAPDYNPNAMGEYYHDSWYQYSWDKNRMTAVDNGPVYPGYSGLFQFYFDIPGSQSSGRYTHAGVKRGYVRPVADGEVWMEDYGAYVHFVGATKLPEIGYWTWNLAGGRHVMVGICDEVPSDFDATIFAAAWPWVAEAGFPFEGVGRSCTRPVKVNMGEIDPSKYASTVNPIGCGWPGNITCMDIYLNSLYEQGFRDSINDPNAPVDLYAIMMHEFGHVTGVGHNMINKGSEEPTRQHSPMYKSYNYQGVRHLTEYELVFVSCIYRGVC